ncbi:hypothetical protein L1765_08025 [Microaerobacter geothermalis]|uniref:hypothetical protein n=1 Tax=Microaerobacter geothermalis TaxID=674972 RepID=UPI001F36560D|nr:hypothetical protein [Microaerobacter geothermalis]MCF6093917.1 hypothetical protein [Microaerobacter geothermalis]
MIVFNIQVSEELREKIKQTVKDQLHDLEDGEPFAILGGERLIVGYRQEGGKVVIEQIVEKVIGLEDMAGEQQKPTE